MKRIRHDHERPDRVPAERVYRGQTYLYEGCTVIPDSGWRRSFTLVYWGTCCPECGVGFTVSMTKSKSIRTKDFRPNRRCSRHHMPGVVVELPVVKPKRATVQLQKTPPSEIAIRNWMDRQGFTPRQITRAIADERQRQKSKRAA